MKANYDYNDKEISGIGLSQKKKKKNFGDWLYCSVMVQITINL